MSKHTLMVDDDCTCSDHRTRLHHWDGYAGIPILRTCCSCSEKIAETIGAVHECTHEEEPRWGSK